MEWILMDIEGTTTSIDFVHRVLFPFSRSHLHGFLKKNYLEPKLIIWLDQIWTQDLKKDKSSPIDLSLIENTLVKWIDEDKKHPALKSIQGQIWQEGYEQKAYTSHVFPDVPEAFSFWKKKGLRLAIYSSGSVAAQKLLFTFSTSGNLTSYIDYYFDTGIGQKREKSSYDRIIEQLAPTAAPQVLFLSDIGPELDAARAAGMRTCQLLREGTEPYPSHQGAPDFHAVSRTFQLV